MKARPAPTTCFRLATVTERTVVSRIPTSCKRNGINCDIVGGNQFRTVEIPVCPENRLKSNKTSTVCASKVLVGKPEGKRRLGRPRRRWKDNIKMALQEVGMGCGDWMELTRDRDRWRALVNSVMNVRVP